jgi:hypothetical protein
MGFASSALPRPIAAYGTAVRQSSQAQSRSEGDDDAQAQVRKENSATSEGTASSASPNSAPLLAEPFGLAATPVGAGTILLKWRGVEADIRADRQILARCENEPACPQAARRFLAIVALGRAQRGRARIGVINRAINFAIKPMSDLAQWP